MPIYKIGNSLNGFLFDSLPILSIILSMARDIIHNQVKNALIKDGWIITADPFQLEYQEFRLFVDLLAEQPFTAQKENQNIAVEIKSFVGQSFVYSLQQAIGQFTMYHKFLKKMMPEYQLFMAINEIIYYRYFEQNAVQLLMQELPLALIVVNIQREEIVKWINSPNTKP